MNEKTWYFIYRNFTVGGNETLIIRIASYLSKNGLKGCLVHETISPEIERDVQLSGLKKVKIESWSVREIISRIRNNHCLILTFRIQTYFLISNALRGCHVLMYCVHPYHLTFDNERDGLAKKAKMFVFFEIMMDGIRSGTIIFMDDDSRKIVERKYRIHISKKLVYLLPYEDSQKLKTWAVNGTRCRKILSVCRADFPFKGYVMGLADAVKKLHDEGENIYLHIVSSGKDISVLKKKIEGFDYIQLTEGLPYEQLETAYLEADIYAGMGQTILEAASYGVPAIVADANTMDFTVAGYFHNNPRCCSSFGSGYAGIDFLRNLCQMDNQDLEKLGSLSRSLFRQMYSMSGFVRQLSEQEWKRKCNLYEKILFSLLKDRIAPW